MPSAQTVTHNTFGADTNANPQNGEAGTEEKELPALEMVIHENTVILHVLVHKLLSQLMKDFRVAVVSLHPNGGSCTGYLALRTYAQIQSVSTGPRMSQFGSVMGRPVPNEKRFCLSNGGYVFLVMSVPVETTSEEFQNLSLPEDEDYIPEEKLSPTILKVNLASSLVSVGSMVYSIGGCKLDEQNEHVPTNEVTTFDTDQSQLKLESCCSMILPRVSPAVVGIDGKIYVFGGFYPMKETFKECPWAEFLDTNKPKYKQKWKVLKEPVSRLSFPVAFHYEADTILISSGSNVKQDDILYNVANESSVVNHSKSARDMIKPLTVFEDKTVYWIDGGYFKAYELDKHICYLGYTDEVLPDFENRLWSTTQGPILVHLKDNLFNIFTLFAIGSHPDNMIGTLECTKIRCTKRINKSGEGVLQLDRVGYKSYKCEPLWSLSSVLPIYS
ncbi:hypothetical protein POM88_005095 [Heracleum sosnowskyi]|uniref:Uncharacterized protein n=1 Tax=Heracleum sosnowskyi TaxID=360622 RepID=A0AAD8JPC7_9APIA|nr:hypothetical protein POM88_005095 [Heracleum sosnowskyi]